MIVLTFQVIKYFTKGRTGRHTATFSPLFNACLFLHLKHIIPLSDFLAYFAHSSSVHTIRLDEVLLNNKSFLVGAVKPTVLTLGDGLVIRELGPELAHCLVMVRVRCSNVATVVNLGHFEKPAEFS